LPDMIKQDSADEQGCFYHDADENKDIVGNEIKEGADCDGKQDDPAAHQVYANGDLFLHIVLGKIVRLQVNDGV